MKREEMRKEKQRKQDELYFEKMKNVIIEDLKIWRHIYAIMGSIGRESYFFETKIKEIQLGLK